MALHHSPASRLNSGAWPNGPPRILLADDHAIITDGLRQLLEPECEIVGAVTDGRTLIKAARALRPDIVVADVTMPSLNGIDATRQLLQELPKIYVIFLTMHADRVYAAEAFDAGALGFVVKHAASAELWQAINAVVSGGAYVSPLVGGQGAIGVKGRAKLRQSLASRRLSTRQRQVLQLIAEGDSIKQVAIRLKLAPKTVEFHKYRIMRDFAIDSSAQLIQFALRHGLIV